MIDYKLIFEKNIKENPERSLDQLLHDVYDEVKINTTESYDIIRNKIIEANNIDEYEYYTMEVREDLKDYVNEFIYPQYDLNDKGHGIIHVREVVRRSFALNDTFKLNLDKNMIYAIASCHDIGKYVDHTIHEKIAARRFIDDQNMKRFFTDEQRKIIAEAIEDHRSSKEDNPRSGYGKLISSADRNTSIEMVFIRSFFVEKERKPEMIIEDYLDYTIDRLSKKYDEESPENMFYEDVTYKEFIKDMRSLLKNKEEFKNRYCEVNNITSRQSKLMDEQGKVSYVKKLKK